MNIDASGRGVVVELHVGNHFLHNQVVYHRGDVHQGAHPCVVEARNGLFQLSEFCACPGKLYGIGILGRLHGYGHTDNVGVEVVGCQRFVGRAIVDIQRQQQSSVLIDIDAIPALLHLLRHHVEPHFLAIQRYGSVA